MPTISEDGLTDQDSICSGDEANYEHLVVKMLEERDKLMDTLSQVQETLALTKHKLQDAERERDVLQKQMQSSTPPVSISSICCITSLDTFGSILIFVVRTIEVQLCCC